MRQQTVEGASRRCECADCRAHPDGPTAQEHRWINHLLACSHERSRRLLAGFLAQRHGRGGLALLHRITGLDRNTIARGRRELLRGDGLPGRVRRPGGGRKRTEATHPGR